MLKRHKDHNPGWVRWLLLPVMAALLLGVTQAPSCAAGDDPAGGIGGTGISGSGIGGTGITGEGVGGTGIQRLTGFGPIQRFGSIFVNGREYLLDEATRYRVDGRPATARDLRLGDVVRVQAHPETPSGRMVATSVQIESALRGIVDRVDPRAGRFMLLGQAVYVTAETRTSGLGARPFQLARLHAGEWVSVSGLARGDGGWVATRVVRRAADVRGATFLLTGQVSAIDAVHGRLTIGGRTLAAAPGALTRVAVGDAVRITGRYTGGRPIVTGVRPVAAIAGSPGTVVEMSGYVQASAGPGALLIDGVRLRYTAQTRFTGGAATDLKPGATVAVRGIARPDGSVLVNQMVLDVDPMQVELPQALHPQAGAGAQHAAPGGRPEGGKPEAGRPEVAKPEIERPEIERPEIDLPNIDLPSPAVDHPGPPSHP